MTEQEKVPLRPGIIFRDTAAPDNLRLQPARHFSADDASFSPQDEQDMPPGEDSGDEQPLVAVLRPRRSLWRNILLLGVCIFLASVIARTGDWLITAWQNRQWIDAGISLAIGLVVIAGAGSLLAEWRRLFLLRHRAQERDHARQLLDSHDTGRARTFCEQLAARAGINDSEAFRKWQTALQDTHSDREVISLYALQVQPLADKQARATISRFAAESALMIAVSPLAVVDMALIAWRNIRMINQIARIYGIELGYFSRLRLFRGVLFNIAFAGVSELVRETGIDWMSQDIMARLSGRAAQGIGAGLLTARLGIKAMELCRPLPWLEGQKPRLSDYRTDLLTRLRQAMKKKPASGSPSKDPSSPVT